MGQQLGALSAFTKDPDSVPSSQTPAHTIWNARSEVLSHMVNSYTYRQNIHIHTRKKISKLLLLKRQHVYWTYPCIELV